MSSIDLVRMGLKNLLRRKTRTFLTVLGVIIGTASIVSMLSLGFGMRESFQNQISSMGSMTTIEVYQSYGGGGYGRPSMSQSTGELDEKAIAQFKQLNGVKAVTPIIENYVKIVSGRYVADVPIRGIVPETMRDFDYKIKEGRLLSSGEELAVVFGGQMVYNFRDSKSSGRFVYWGGQGQDEKPKVNVLVDKLQLTFDMSYGMKMPPGQQNTNKPPKLHKIKCVGILEEGQNDSYAVYMDIAQLKKLVQDNMRNTENQNSMGRSSLQDQLKYQRAMVKVEDMKYVKEVQEKIKEMGFQTHSLNDILDSMQKTSSTIQLVLGGIGAVSLLVAALGITNTMIMSIYERTREIGIMKVIGASLKDIRSLFLFESAMIGLLGGLLGIGLSFTLSYFINTAGRNFGMFMGIGGPDSKISIIPLWLVIAVMGFTSMVGLLSGYYPARRAMKLSALEAIKNE